MLFFDYFSPGLLHAFDNAGYVGTVLMDLSNAYDCIPYDFLIPKLEAYGLDKTSLHLLRNCPSNQKQWTYKLKFDLLHILK